MQDIIIANGTVVTLGEENRIIPDAAVVLQEGLIKEIGKVTDFAGGYPGAQLIDAHGGLIMPGFINTHLHFYGAFARGMPFDGPAPSNFAEILEAVWWRLDKALTLDDVRYSALLGVADCIHNGTTSVIDHHASPNAVKGSLDSIARATLEAGIRACLCYEVSDRDGKRVAQQGIDENERFLKRCRGEWAEEKRIAGAFGLHASFTVDDETLQKTAAVVKELDAPVHIHVCEGTHDGRASQEKFNARPVARLEKAGLLSHPALLAHCIDLTPEERRLLATRQAWVMHNPESNMNNAVGTLPVCDMLNDGVRVAIGTDGFTTDMRQEARVLGLIHKAATLDPRTLGFDQIYKMLFLHNAELASSLFRLKVGVLELGAAADCIILRYDPPTPMTADNFMGHFFFGMPGTRVETTIVGGQLLMHEGRLLTLDEAAIAARSREMAPHVWKRME